MKENALTGPVPRSHAEHPAPTARLWALIREEKGDLVVLIIYTLITGLAALAVPLAVQALVNTIAQGIFLQPLVVLTALVLGFMLFVGVLRLLQLSLVETLQQRVFARIALQLANSIPRIQNAALADEYGPELVNRFFDVLTIQKALAKLLLDGLAYTLTVCGGLLLMAFYSSYLFGFDLLVVLFTFVILFVFGWRGLRTSILESVMKYRVAQWLEELARCQTSLKMSGSRDYLTERADDLVVGYVMARRAHFRVLFRQALGNYVFQAFASAGVLAIGGWLVINRELTLGQLVASQLIVVSVLAAVDKLVLQSEQVYDLLTGLDKVGHVTDLPVEREGGRELPPDNGGVSVVCRGARFSYLARQETLAGINLEIKAGERVGLVGASGAGKTTLAALFCGLDEPSHGTVEVNGMDVRDVSLESLRAAVALVSDTDEIFDGTIEENIAVGRPNVSHEDVRRALDLAELTDDLTRMPDGIKTMLVSGGKNLSRGQRQRLLIARAVVDRPRLLILDEAFTGIDERTRQRILDAIYDSKNAWTILSITHIDEVIVRCNTVYVLIDGQIVEAGAMKALAAKPTSKFATLFPFLCQQTMLATGTPVLNTIASSTSASVPATSASVPTTGASVPTTGASVPATGASASPIDTVASSNTTSVPRTGVSDSRTNTGMPATGAKTESVNINKQGASE